MELNRELERLQKYAPIDTELKRAKAKHPNYPDNMYEQLAIITEEIGEANKAVLEYHHGDGNYEDIRKELIQSAAVCMRMIENLNKA